MAVQLGVARAALAVLVEGSQEVLLAAMEANTAAVRSPEGGGERLQRRGGAICSRGAGAARGAAAERSARPEPPDGRSAVECSPSTCTATRTPPRLAVQFGAAAEELSATVQELSGAAAEILTATDQISRGAQMQAASTQQSSAAMAQIQKAAAESGGNSRDSVEQSGRDPGAAARGPGGRVTAHRRRGRTA